MGRAIGSLWQNGRKSRACLALPANKMPENPSKTAIFASICHINGNASPML